MSPHLEILSVLSFILDPELLEGRAMTQAPWHHTQHLAWGWHEEGPHGMTVEPNRTEAGLEGEHRAPRMMPHAGNLQA